MRIRIRNPAIIDTFSLGGRYCQLPRLSPAERQYLTQLVAGQGKDFLKRTPAFIHKADPTTVPAVRIRL